MDKNKLETSVCSYECMMQTEWKSCTERCVVVFFFFQVLCLGPTGTGKTLTVSDKLLKNMPSEYITHFLMFSARTSANQTQDYIDSKLDKRSASLRIEQRNSI